MLLATKWFGSFLVDDTRVVRQALFPKDPAGIAGRLFDIQKGHILEEEWSLAAGRKVNVLESRLQPIGKMVVADTSFILAGEFGFRESLLKDALLSLAELKSKESVGGDRHLMEAIATYDSVQEQLNQLDLRLHSWYGLHYPELADLLKGVDYSKTISSLGDRSIIQGEHGLHGVSIGVDFIPNEKERLMALASAVLYLTDLLDRTGEFIDTQSAVEFPDLSLLLGPKLACRMVKESGGLERMSSFPAGTVQLIGAEKALFRHLRKGRKPPKHGLIFQHPLVHSMPREHRGQISRFLASKAVIAARVDRFHGKHIGERLKAEVEKRAEELRKAPSSKRHDATTGHQASRKR